MGQRERERGENREGERERAESYFAIQSRRTQLAAAQIRGKRTRATRSVEHRERASRSGRRSPSVAERPRTSLSEPDRPWRGQSPPVHSPSLSRESVERGGGSARSRTRRRGPGATLGPARQHVKRLTCPGPTRRYLACSAGSTSSWGPTSWC